MINVNRNSSEPDNLPATIDTKKKVYKIPHGAATILLSLAGILFVFWFLFMFVSYQYCMTVYYSVCAAFTISAFSVPAIILVMLVSLTVGVIVFVYQNGMNAAWLENLGMFIHRDDARASYNRAFDVLVERAKSEATRGMDTYSPSYSGSSAKEPIQKIENKDPLVSARVNIEDIFARKNDEI